MLVDLGVGGDTAILSQQEHPLDSPAQGALYLSTSPAKSEIASTLQQMQSSITKPAERQDSSGFSLNCFFKIILKYCLFYTVDINSFSKGLKHGKNFIPVPYPHALSPEKTV